MKLGLEYQQLSILRPGGQLEYLMSIKNIRENNVNSREKESRNLATKYEERKKLDMLL